MLKVFFERCVRWLRRGVLPVVVLEGRCGGRADRRCTPGRGALGPAFAPQPAVRALLGALGVPCLDADGEAEDCISTMDLDLHGKTFKK